MRISSALPSKWTSDHSSMRWPALCVGETTAPHPQAEAADAHRTATIAASPAARRNMGYTMSGTAGEQLLGGQAAHAPRRIQPAEHADQDADEQAAADAPGGHLGLDDVRDAERVGQCAGAEGAEQQADAGTENADHHALTEDDRADLARRPADGRHQR